MPISSSDPRAHPEAGVKTALVAQAMQRAFAAYARGGLGEAEWLCRCALDAKPEHFDALRLLGTIAIQTGRGREAADLLGRAVAGRPGDPAARVNLGVVLQNLKRPMEAMEAYMQAIALKPDFAEAYNNLGFTLRELGRLGEALAYYNRALELKPEYAEAHNNRGIALQEMNQLDDALASYDHALALKPDYGEAYHNRGSVLQRLKRPEEALDSYDRAIKHKPDFAEAYNHRAIALQALGRLNEARYSCELAIGLNPDYAEAYINLGFALRKLRRLDEALASYDQALKIDPELAEAHNHRGVALRDLGRPDDALASYDRALEVKPDYVEACNNRGHALLQVGRHSDAAQSFARVLVLAPEFRFAKGNLLHAKMLHCDWTSLAALYESVRRDCIYGKPSAEPFGYQAISDSERELRICAETYAATQHPKKEPQLISSTSRKIHDRRIRVGYLSGEFRNQATSLLMTELFELHDPNRFQVFAFDNGWDDGSDIRLRINAAFSEIVDIARSSDLEAAALVKAREIDILVNLNGYFGQGRQGVFAHRPSPVQVNYLGFPGTLGADYIDYLIADHTVIPESSRQHYTEKIAYLPNCYQVNDRKKVIADKTFSREELGLPRTGFVFCCFNNNYKITPDTFDVWMRILGKVEGSVLWLLQDNPAAASNLRMEATARGVSAGRLIFAERMPPAEHLARHRAADLFVDTLPCNAHTTASDALWAGLPLLTCIGQTFPGRVAASLLKAVGLRELITTTREEYEARAVELAFTPQLLEQIKEKLGGKRVASPLFDTPLFTEHIQDAYAQMYERHQAHLPPDHIYVSSLAA